MVVKVVEMMMAMSLMKTARVSTVIVVSVTLCFSQAFWPSVVYSWPAM